MASPLRITRKETSGAAVAAGKAVAAAKAVSPGPTTPMQDYMERLVKLIPAEVVGLYLVGIGIIPTGSEIATAVWAIVCLFLVVLVRAYATGDKAADPKVTPQWSAVLVSSISFVIWVYNIQGPFQVYHLAVPYVGSLSVLLWTFVVPYFYKGD